MRHWKDAKTVADLGQLMADWLEGRIPRRPGYGDTRPDPETNELIPVLAACNRAGFITDSSQPGFDGPGFDGAHWRQRAAVTGFVADRALLARLASEARAAGLQIVTDGRPVVAVERNGESRLAFGDKIRRGYMRTIWGGIGRDALREVSAAQQIAIIDPVWGESDRLWQMLRQVT